MRIAAVQTAPRFGAVDENRRRAAALVRSVRADLYVLPELFNTGYLFNDREEVDALAEPYPEGPTCRFLADLSIEMKSVIVAGFAERMPDGRLYNSAALFEDGRPLDCYRKIHLFDREFDWFDAGTDPPRVVHSSHACLGAMICFDWIFPETMRCLALAGAQVIVHAANLVMPYCPDAMVTRCLENGVFGVTANRIGQDTRPVGTLEFIGRSQITGHRGERLAQAGEDREQVILAEIDPALADDKQLNAGNHLVRDRRPGLYGRLTS